MSVAGGRGGLVRMGVLALLWGSTFLWIEVALTGFSPVQLTVIRCVLGAAVLVAITYAGGRRLPRDRATWGHLLVAAFFCNALPFALFGLGQQTVGSGVAGVLNATTPLWSLLIGVALGTERGLGAARLGGLLLGFAGVVLIFAPWESSDLVGWGALAILGAAASYAVAFAYMGRTLATRGGGTVPVAAAQLVVATGWAALAVPVAGRAPVAAGAAAIGAVVMLGVFSTGATFYLSVRMIAEEGPVNAAAVGYLLPVVSVALGVVVLGEAVSVRVVAGTAVVLAGVALSRWRRTAKRPSAEVAEGREVEPVAT